ncbi:MAG: type pilus assembly protein PilC [Thermoleophilaceae bacterium]|jgi:type IV pilus assembly protein PilC|nr:type pilus assembly protein PilC [Thermoleophilaceae bacterium]
MATFAFKAVDLQGVPTRGELDAESKVAVSQQLRSKGMIVLDIEEQKNTDIGDYLGRFKRVKAQELTIATRQLSTMISSGMSLLRALYVLEEQARSDKFREAITSIRMDVEAGISLSAALERHPDIFNGLYIAMVSAGEVGGILESTLDRVADQLEKDDSLRRQVKAAMMYPMLIGGFALSVLIALVVFLVPVFEKVFHDFGGNLPPITKFTVAFSNLLTGQWYLCIAVSFGLVTAFKKWKKTERGREQWDRFKLRIPWKIGDLVQKVCLARFSRTYSALIGAGVPMLQAIEITGKTSGNKVIEKAMFQVGESVRAGGSISTPMRAEPGAFPIMVTQMIGVGEETGALEQMLSKIADFYEDEVAAGLKALTSILEPVMIVVVGGMVGFIVVSMYMPMFKVYDQIR